MDSNIWLKISGGVASAAIIKTISIVYLLYLINDLESTIPALDKKYITIGSWKAIPVARGIVNEVLIILLKSNWFEIDSDKL